MREQMDRHLDIFLDEYFKANINHGENVDQFHSKHYCNIMNMYRDTNPSRLEEIVFESKLRSLVIRRQNVAKIQIANNARLAKEYHL